MVRDTKDAGSGVDANEAYKRFQAQYGERPEKAREIKKNLGKDDFLKIMISQMKNQDPLNPFKSDQMGTQIAQFTSVEQLQNVNQNLNKMSNQNKPLEQLAMTNLIGKTVTIDRERFSHIEGQNDSLTFVLPRNAESLQAVIVNDAGEEVAKKDLGPNKKGDITFNWDGIKSNTLGAKSGTYTVKVVAKDDHDKPIEVSSRRQTRVIGISFEGNEPVFLVGNAEHQDKVSMKNIAKIEMLDEAKDEPKPSNEITNSVSMGPNFGQNNGQNAGIKNEMNKTISNGLNSDNNSQKNTGMSRVMNSGVNSGANTGMNTVVNSAANTGMTNGAPNRVAMGRVSE